MVAYDLNVPHQDYATLIDKLKSYPNWCKPLKSTWLLKTPMTYSQVRDELRGYIDASDDLLVIDVTGRPAAWFGLPAEVSKWILDNL